MKLGYNLQLTGGRESENAKSGTIGGSQSLYGARQAQVQACHLRNG
jgi:hypothetical protein